MNRPAHVVLDLAVRGGALLTGEWAFTRVWDATTAGPHETDIGGGLVGLGLLALAALVWGALDGRHHDVGRLAATWVGAGLLVGAFVAVLLVVRGGDRGEVLLAVALLVPFLAVLVAAPAVLAGVLSRTLLHRPVA
ncbi:MAG: hypothetical protein ABIQ59_06215 [Nocardioidaceae bacterium]